MTDQNRDEKKPRNRFPDRFTIEPENLEKVGKLLDQLRSTVQGCDATRKELLNWIVEKFQSELSVDDLQELTVRFYDEERFLKLALDQVREAKSRGERRTIEEILQKKPQSATPAVRRPRKKKSDVTADVGLAEPAQDSPQAEAN